MKTALAVAAMLAFGVICAQAQGASEADMQAQQLCGNDVFRLCGDAVPDRGRIEACMRRKFRQVSAPCRGFMAHYGKARHERVVRHSRHHHATRHHESRRHHRYSYRNER